MANTIVVDIVADTRKLVAGVGQTNQQLNKLNGTATAISKGFGLITKALAAIQGARLVWGWIKDFETEQNNFERIAENFGKSSDKVIEKVGELSAKFKIDDGDIAASLNQLANSTTFRYKKLLPQITELILLADNLSGGAGENIDKYTSAWSKALKSGKVLDGQDLVKLGITSKLTEAEQKQFQGLKTITEQVQFLYGALEQELQPDALKFTAAQELTYEVDQLKEAVAKLLSEEVVPLLLTSLKTLKNLLFFKDEEGNLKLREEVAQLAQALALLWTVGKLAAVVTALQSSNTALAGIAKELKAFPGLLKGLSFGEIGVAFGILIKSIWQKLGVFGKGLVAFFAVEIGERALKQLAKLLPEKFEWLALELINGFFLPFKDPVAAVKRFIQMLKDFWEGIKESIINFAIASFRIGSPSKETAKIGEQVIAGFFQPFKNFNFNNVASTIRSFFTTLLSKFKTAITEVKWSSLGESIINGLVAGMRAISSGPIDFITKLATNMKNTFKRFFNISSPSKVFAGYGKNLMQGLALGISGNQSLATSALNLPLTPSFGNARGSSITVNINAGIGTDPYEVGRYVKAALDKYAGVNGR